MVNDPPHHNHNHNHHHQDGWGRAALGDSSVKEEKWRRPTHDDKLATPNHVHHRALTHENKLKQNWNYSQENRILRDAFICREEIQKRSKAVQAVQVVQVAQVVFLVQVVRVARVVKVVQVIKFVNVNGLHGLKNQIIEKSWDVTPVTD